MTSCPCARPCDSFKTHSILMTDAHPISFKRGEVLWQEGDQADWLLAVCTSHVKLTHALPGGRSLTLDLVGRGELAGEEAADPDGIRVTAAVALDNGRGMRLSQRRLLEQLETRPLHARVLMSQVLKRNATLTERLVSLARDPVDRRLATALHQLGVERGLADARGRFIPLRLNRKDLAEMVGCRQETVTRLMADWDRQGVIETLREGLVLRDPGHIQSIAGAA